MAEVDDPDDLVSYEDEEPGTVVEPQVEPAELGMGEGGDPGQDDLGGSDPGNIQAGDSSLSTHDDREPDPEPWQNTSLLSTPGSGSDGHNKDGMKD
jgi:hypothetical protein